MKHTRVHRKRRATRKGKATRKGTRKHVGGRRYDQYPCYAFDVCPETGKKHRIDRENPNTKNIPGTFMMGPMVFRCMDCECW